MSEAEPSAVANRVQQGAALNIKLSVLDQSTSVVMLVLDSWEQPQNDLWAVLLHQGHIPSSPTDGKTTEPQKNLNNQK